MADSHATLAFCSPLPIQEDMTLAEAVADGKAGRARLEFAGDAAAGEVVVYLAAGPRWEAVGSAGVETPEALPRDSAWVGAIEEAAQRLGCSIPRPGWRLLANAV